MNRGVWQAAGAYAIWGLLPLYWRALHQVPAPQLISHRIVWSTVLLLAVVAMRGQLAQFAGRARAPRTLAIYAAAAALLGVNWLTYVWAVNAGFVVETSLGYFINPLLSVVLGVVFLGERLRPAQWASVAIAALGVAYLAFDYGRLPWIALVLAFTFAVYGLVKKQAPLGSVDGLALETSILFVPAFAVLATAAVTSGAPVLGSGWQMALLLVGTGIVTTVPLLLFSSAARRIPMLWIGILQYIAPSIQFLLGVFVFKEAVSVHTLVGFGIVWSALFLFAGEALARRVAEPVTAE
ncbi:MAG: EamA family transporter RarD [Actinobacteria bacterium]|nr:MAG: EamA family transporter RarD [Actinomycetota bacterium]